MLLVGVEAMSGQEFLKVVCPWELGQVFLVLEECLTLCQTFEIRNDIILFAPSKGVVVKGWRGCYYISERGVRK